MSQQAPYSGFIRKARDLARRGQLELPSDARFHLLEASIEDEAREGIRILPANAQKPNAENPTEPEIQNPVLEAQREQYAAAEHALRKGLIALAQSVKELTTQFPDRLSVRNQKSIRPLNRLELNGLGHQLRWSLADNLISQVSLLTMTKPASKQAESDKLAEAQELLTALAKGGGSTGLVDLLKSRLLVEEQNWSEAAWLLEQTRVRLAGRSELKNRIDLLLDQCYQRIGNPDQQLNVAERALRENPNWLPAIVGLPELYRRANRIPDALKAYDRIKALPGASLTIAQLRLQQELAKPVESREWKKIHEALEAEKVSGLERPGRVAILKAEVAALEAAQLEDQGQAALAHEKYQTAQTVLDEARKTSSESADLWAARALLELKLPFPANRTTQDRIAAAEDYLNQGLEAAGDHLPLRLAAAQMALLLPPAEALRELKELEQSQLPLAEQPRFLEGLAQAHMQLGLKFEDQKEKEAALERVMSLHQEAAESQSTDIQPQIALAELAYRQKDTGTMGTAIERVEQVEGPAGPNGDYLKALRLTVEIQSPQNMTPEEMERFSEARRLLQRAKRQRPFWADLPHALGDLEKAIGNLEGAVTHYERAYQLGDRSSLMIYTMVEHYRNQQRFEYADEFLRKVATDRPILLSGELARQQWQVAWNLRRKDEAIAIASKYASRSKDFRDHVWEAGLRFSQYERGPAVLEPLKKACELAPKESVPWQVLVEYYARTNDLPAAEATIEQAKTSIAKKPAFLVPVTIARCYEYINDRAKAEQHYLAALKATKEKTSERITQQIILADFYSRTPGTPPKQLAQDILKANQILDKLLDRSSDIPQYARDWAHRRKALIATVSGRYDDTQRAFGSPGQGPRGRRSVRRRPPRGVKNPKCQKPLSRPFGFDSDSGNIERQSRVEFR